MKVTFILALAILVSACTGGPPPQTCSQLGWSCGIDDYGRSCGSCGSLQYCSAGACVGDTVCSCGGATCGTDNCGRSCGFCGAGESCQGGACIGVCDTRVFAPCTAASSCCPDTVHGRNSACTLLSGTPDAYCEPICASDFDCADYNTSVSTWSCVARTDGVRVCVPN